MRTVRIRRGQIKTNQSYVAEPLEIQLARAMSAEEPIKMGSPITYTEEQDGVVAATDIRTDRFEIVQEATDKIAKMERSKRLKTQESPETGGEKGSTQTTPNTEN